MRVHLTVTDLDNVGTPIVFLWAGRIGGAPPSALHLFTIIISACILKDSHADRLGLCFCLLVTWVLEGFSGLCVLDFVFAECLCKCFCSYNLLLLLRLFRPTTIPHFMTVKLQSIFKVNISRSVNFKLPRQIFKHTASCPKCSLSKILWRSFQ